MNKIATIVTDYADDFESDFNDKSLVTKKYVDDNSGSSVWGEITGTLNNQTDLQTELDLISDNVIAMAAAL